MFLEIFTLGHFGHVILVQKLTTITILTSTKDPIFTYNTKYTSNLYKFLTRLFTVYLSRHVETGNWNHGYIYPARINHKFVCPTLKKLQVTKKIC